MKRYQKHKKQLALNNHNNYNKNLQNNANVLRHNMTKSEACLWKYVLKANKMRGYAFRRQRPIGPYIADFACLELMLIIELDGMTHLFEETQVKDKRKENYLKELGYTVLRFKDEEVLKSINLVAQEIETAIEKIVSLPRPSGTPSGGGQLSPLDLSPNS